MSLFLYELMNSRNGNRFRDECRMDKNTFLRLLSKLRTEAGLEDSIHIPAGKAYGIHRCGFSNRELANQWQCSRATIHDCVYDISRVFISIQERFFILPSPTITPAVITNNDKYSPFFDNCIDLLDGCHCSCMN